MQTARMAGIPNWDSRKGFHSKGRHSCRSIRPYRPIMGHSSSNDVSANPVKILQAFIMRICPKLGQ